MPENKELLILKWVGIALACLSTVFTLIIVGSHLSGRMVGMGKAGIIGTIGAELMAIICAWLAATERKRVAGVAMISQIVLTAILLINASIALDLDWQETLSNKASEQRLAAQKQADNAQQRMMEKQAELARELAQTDKRLAREFVRSGKAAAKLPSSSEPKPEEPGEAKPLDIAKLTVYERYGLTIVPLFLALLTVVALGLAAHSSGSATVYESGNVREFPSPGHRDANYRSGSTRSNFDSQVATQAHTNATQPPGVATQPATQDGLAVLRQTLSDIAFRCPGKWFKVDVRPDHVRIRLNRREQGKEVTEQSGKLRLEVLASAVAMQPEPFRERLTRLLIKKGFQI